jgi:aminobenzoyl-glutamate utilization protein B
MKETKSKVLADYAQEQGFRVTRGVEKYLPLLLLNMERLTIIGVLGEFDALPGLSQNKLPKRL